MISSFFSNINLAIIQNYLICIVRRSGFFFIAFKMLNDLPSNVTITSPFVKLLPNKSLFERVYNIYLELSFYLCDNMLLHHIFISHRSSWKIDDSETLTFLIWFFLNVHLNYICGSFNNLTTLASRKKSTLDVAMRTQIFRVNMRFSLTCNNKYNK